MTKSMTAFARAEVAQVAWEVRSVNQRYLDINFKMPDTFRSLEPELRNTVRKSLQRGKLDCVLRVDVDAAQAGEIKVDDAVLDSLKTAIARVQETLELSQEANPMDVLRWPGVLVDNHEGQSEIELAIKQAFSDAIVSLVEMRSREGKELETIILGKLDELEAIVVAVEQEVPLIQARQKQKLEERLAELVVDVDEGRLEQEVAFLAQKSDVAEEIDRLKTHVEEVRSTIKQKGPIGRRLDFLMQELNREANTLSSKAIAANTTVQSVELKVIIEQMREQVQNIE